MGGAPRVEASEGKVVVVAMDSFKGSIDAARACRAFADGWTSSRPMDRVTTIPMADGGEGTTAAIAALHSDAEWRSTPATSPDNRVVDASWLLLPDGTAVVEVAASSGLPLVEVLNPMGATSSGVGDVLRAASTESRTSRILVALGGSAMTDGGAGALVALGARLLDANGKMVRPEPRLLRQVVRVDFDGLIAPPRSGTLLLTDVGTPLLGPTGASHQFAPQKGADPHEVIALELALAHWARVLGADASASGSGAAGGLAFGLAHAWGARIISGAAYIARLSGLSRLIDQADVVVTGEGRFDGQSRHGKVVGHVLALAGEGRVTHIVCGSKGPGADPGSSRTLELVVLAGSTRAALADPGHWLCLAGARLGSESN